MDTLTDSQIIEYLATKVMGWEYEPRDDFYWTDPKGEKEKMFGLSHEWAWNPLTDWNHTMEVVNKLVLTDCERFRMSDYQISCGWEVNIGENGWHIDFDAKRAICLAALKAVTPPQND